VLILGISFCQGQCTISRQGTNSRLNCSVLEANRKRQSECWLAIITFATCICKKLYTIICCRSLQEAENKCQLCKLQKFCDPHNPCKDKTMESMQITRSFDMVLNLNFKNHGSYLISVVHSRYASDLTVTISLSKRLQVLIKDPNAIGVSSASHPAQ